MKFEANVSHFLPVAPTSSLSPSNHFWNSSRMRATGWAVNISINKLLAGHGAPDA